MAKLKDLESGLLQKKNLKKSAVVGEKEASKITKKVHTPRKEKIIKTSIDLPESFYKRLKIKVVENGESMKSYLMRLVEEDLNK